MALVDCFGCTVRSMCWKRHSVLLSSLVLTSKWKISVCNQHCVLHFSSRRVSVYKGTCSTSLFRKLHGILQDASGFTSFRVLPATAAARKQRCQQFYVECLQPPCDFASVSASNGTVWSRSHSVVVSNTTSDSTGFLSAVNAFYKDILVFQPSCIWSSPALIPT